MNYYNSMIERKKGICLDCGIENYLTAGRCSTHYSIYRKKLILENRKEKSKVRSLINTPNNKKLLVKNEIIENVDLVLWYKIKMELNEPRCAECQSYKPALKQWPKGWKSCQAHLLPKSKFKSISTHPLNCLVLGSGLSGMCHHHDEYDSSWEKAAKMSIWPEVVRRFKILYPLIEENEHQFIPSVLLKEILIY